MMDPIRFYSTNLKTEPVTFRKALLKGIAPDRGLFFPEEIPQINHEELKGFQDLDYPEIAFAVMSKFLRAQIEDTELLALLRDAYNYPVPLEKLVDRKYVMRLDQGPTASFKDFAARMMGRLMNHYLTLENRKLLILTATSGDTGSAIANAFYGLDNIGVVVLFPCNEVTTRQRKQMTTLGKNVQIISIDGKFDDCQAMVKEAFADSDLDYLNLSSANSINIGRLIPQIVYYFYAYSRLSGADADEKAIFSVPSGNFGDMMGGMLAGRMGLPVLKYVIATNANNEFPLFLKSGNYSKIEPSRNCISSAMNVGHPSNLSRLLAVYGGVMDEKGNISKPADMERMRREIYAISIDDRETKETIKKTYQEYNVLLEPHGAVGWAGLERYANEAGISDAQLCISLETAHPAKFPEQIQDLLNIDPELPPSLEGIEQKEESYVELPNNFADFKDFLVKNY